MTSRRVSYAPPPSFTTETKTKYEKWKRREKQVDKAESWEWVDICRGFWPYGTMQIDI